MNNGLSMWDAGRVKTISEMWQGGHSLAAIGERLGVSRSTISGKLARLGLMGKRPPRPPRAPSEGRTMGEHKGRRLRVRFRPAQLGAVLRSEPVEDTEPEAVFSSPGCLLDDLTNTTCRWPIEEIGPAKYVYCGATSADMANKIPYCPHHTEVAKNKLARPIPSFFRGFR
jgi:GcrA cell cycle regulator